MRPPRGGESGAQTQQTDRVLIAAREDTRRTDGGESGALIERALPERDNSTTSHFSLLTSHSHQPHRALFVSRMHPKKGVLELVESWARVRQTGMVVQNRITANWYDVVPVDEILGLPMVEVCPSTSRFADKRALKDLFKSFGQVENRSDGRRVTFPAKSVGKMMGQKGVDLYRLAGAFADLFRASRRAWSESEASIEDHKQHRNIDAYHQYIAKFTDGTDECFVRFTVREDKGGGLARNEIHSSTVSRIIVYKAKGAELSNLGHAQVEDSTPFVDNKISYFLNRVNPLANWQCELVYTLNGDTEREYEQRVKQRIIELGMSYSTSDGTDSTDSSLPSAYSRGVGKPNRSKSACAEGTCVPNFILTGPLNDDAKWAAYARADLFILPTYSENFGIVVAEALWACLPVITTKGTPWSELVMNHCGWWIDLSDKKVGQESRSTVEWTALDNAIREATSTSNFDSLRAMGANGHTLVESKYTWPAVVQAMIHGYERIYHA